MFEQLRHAHHGFIVDLNLTAHLKPVSAAFLDIHRQLRKIQLLVQAQFFAFRPFDIDNVRVAGFQRIKQLKTLAWPVGIKTKRLLLHVAQHIRAAQHITIMLALLFKVALCLQLFVAKLHQYMFAALARMKQLAAFVNGLHQKFGGKAFIHRS